jgi:hypothetical protein
MALKQSSEALRRPLNALRIGFPLIALLSLVLGYLGFQAYLPGKGYPSRPLDIVYYDLQLFVLGADPLQNPEPPLPVMLDVARFTAPAVTIYAIAEAIRLLLAAELSRLRARRSAHHAIVCGDTPLADALSRRLQSEDVDVVEIRSEPDESINPGEPLRVIGDPRDPEVLRAAGVDNAAMVYACDERSATNIATALAVGRAAGANGAPISVHGLVSDPDFCCTVQAFFLGREVPQRVRLDFFNLDHIAARRLLADHDWPASRPAPPHVLVSGTDGFGQAIVVEAVRRWRVTAGRASGAPLTVTLVGPDASDVAGGLRRRYPFLATACRLQARNGELLHLIRRGALPEAPDRVLVSHPDEEYALETAMTAEQYWRGRSESVTVRMDGALIGGRTSIERLDVAGGGVLRVFSKVAAAGDPALIQDDLMERIARVLHDRYVLARLSRGEGGSDPAMVSWDELPPRLRRANRAQAEDIGRKLACVGYAITPRYAERLEVSLADADLDRLAKLEHQRWFAEHWNLGWRFGERRDEERRLHPALRAWTDLPETIRLRNYDPFLALPAILGEAGFQIVRAPAVT